MNRHASIPALLVAWAAAGFAADAPSQQPHVKAPLQPKAPSARPSDKHLSLGRSADAAAPDKLSLDTSVITGNRELPKVLYIVPWKRPSLGDLPAQPFNTLLDETLAPIDRDVFRREVDYYQVITRKSDGAPVPIKK